MNIVVTGGAGYVGTVVTSELLRAGHRVIVYDNLSHGARAAVPGGADSVEGYAGDDYYALEALPIGPARQRSLLRIVVTCPMTSASIPFLNCCMPNDPHG